MSTAFIVLLLAAAQTTAPPAPLPGQGGRSVPTIVRKDYDMKELATPPALSETELAGRRLFVQRCGVCHDPVGQARVSGPWLDRETLKRDEAATRRIIEQGSPRMPGFRYALESGQLDSLLAFLQTVAPEDNPRR